MNVVQSLGNVRRAADSQQVALTTTPALSAALTSTASTDAGSVKFKIWVTAAAAIRVGATVAIDGTDQVLAPNVIYEMECRPADTLAIATLTGTGTAYITPWA